MKIDLIKNHTLGKKGGTIMVSQPRGDYLIRMGVAEKHVAKKKPTIKESLQVDKPEKKNDKPKVTRKSKGKPKS